MELSKDLFNTDNKSEFSPSLADYPPPHDMVLPGLFTPATEIVEESDELSTQTGGFLSPGGPVGLSDWPDADLFRLLLVPGTPVGPKSPGDLSEPTSGLGISIQSLRDQVPADWLDTGLSPSATGMSDANMMLQMGIYPTRFTEGGAYTLPALTSALGNTDWPAAGVATSGSRTLPTCTTDRVPIPPAHLPQPGVFLGPSPTTWHARGPRQHHATTPQTDRSIPPVPDNTDNFCPSDRDLMNHIDDLSYTKCSCLACLASTDPVSPMATAHSVDTAPKANWHQSHQFASGDTVSCWLDSVLLNVNEEAIPTLGDSDSTRHKPAFELVSPPEGVAQMRIPACPEYTYSALSESENAEPGFSSDPTKVPDKATSSFDAVFGDRQEKGAERVREGEDNGEKGGSRLEATVLTVPLPQLGPIAKMPPPPRPPPPRLGRTPSGVTGQEAVLQASQGFIRRINYD